MAVLKSRKPAIKKINCIFSAYAKGGQRLNENSSSM